MKMRVRSTIRPKVYSGAIQGDRQLWTFGASEWHRLISPYTPMRTGQLMAKVQILPKQIRYLVPYAWAAYNATNWSFRKDKHPLATARWDIVARPIQGRKLVNSMQVYVNRQNLMRLL